MNKKITIRLEIVVEKLTDKAEKLAQAITRRSVQNLRKVGP